VILIVVAVLSLFVLFFIKNKTTFFNNEKQIVSNRLNTGTATLAEIINKDTDGDGILDWEEGLWGTDPTKKETTPGISDSEAIEKLKAENGISAKNTDENENITENLTKTDQFSRELFSTMITLNQNGAVDQATIDKLGSSLAEKMQNPVIRKVFTLSDIEVKNDNSEEAIINYLKTFDDIHKKYPDISYTVLDVLQELMVDEDSVDVTVLIKLDPIIEQNNKIITALIKMDVPQYFSTLHLDLVNSLERLGENAEDMRLFDTDPIVALGGISQYENNLAQLELSLKNFANGLNQKLSN